MWSPLRSSGSVPLLAAILALTALTSPAVRTPADSAERYTLEGDDLLVVQPVGELRIEPGSGSAVVVEVTRGGRDADQLRIETSRGPRPTLLVRYPGSNVVYPPMGRGTTSTSTDIDLPHESQRFTVRGSGSGIQAWTDMRILVPAGRRIKIRHAVGHASIAGVDARLALDQGWGEVVSRDTRGTLSLDTGSGAVRVTGAEGEVTLDTGSGLVEVANVRGAKLSLDTGSGSVSAKAIRVGTLNADTGSGRVTLSNIMADLISLDTGSGPIEVDLASHARMLRIDTGSGGITIRLPRAFGAVFDIESGSGDIDIDVPHEIIRRAKDHVRGRMGDGLGEIRIEAGSGGVRLTGRSASGTSWHVGPGVLVGFATT